MRNKDNALLAAGIVFLLVALLHLYRLIDQTILFFGNYVVPMWFSLVGLIFALILSLWMFVARKQGS